MQICYINLDSNTRRRQRIDWQLAELGLEATRISATTPADIAPALLAEYCPGTSRIPLSPPELACTLSHLAALEKIAGGSEPFGLILEDDALLSRTLPAFLSDFEKSRPNLDLIKLDSSGDTVRGLYRRAISVAGITLVQVVTDRDCSAAYIISRRAAEQISRNKNILRLPIDHSYHDLTSPIMRGLRTRSCDPGLCTQPHWVGLESESAISDERSHARRRAAAEPKKPGQTIAHFIERRRYGARKVLLQIANGPGTRKKIPFIDDLISLPLGLRSPPDPSRSA